MYLHREELEELVDLFNNNKFKDFDDVKVGEMLSSILADGEIKYSIYRFLKDILYSLFYIRLNIGEILKDGIFFYFTPSYMSREEYLKNFYNVAKCVENSVICYGEKRKGFYIKRACFLPLIYSWKKTIKRIGVSRDVCRRCCFQLYLAKACISEWLGNIKIDKYTPKLAVLFCDTHVIDYLLAVEYKKRGIKTVTLQHAIFPSNVYWWSYLYSPCDEFLAINQYSVLEAKKSGVDVSKYVVLGDLKYLESNPPVFSHLNEIKRYIIGISLSGPAYESENRELLKLGIHVAETKGCKIIIRPHPAVSIERYEKEFNVSKYILSKGSLSQFACECDFIIVGSSNMFSDIIINNCPAIRLVRDKDFFENIQDFKFETIQQLLSFVDDIYNNSKDIDGSMMRIRDMLLVDGDIKENYKIYLSRINAQRSEKL